jgi:hypothetical protein
VIELVKSRLEHHGGGWLTLTAVTKFQDNDLHASYQLFRNTVTNDAILRTISYVLPAALHTLL